MAGMGASTTMTWGGDFGAIDATDIKKLKEKLSRLAGQLGPIMRNIRPEFGAYMNYSEYLERGTHNADGSWKMTPRPHIIPAVEKNAGAITRRMADVATEITHAVFTKTAAADFKKIYQRAWIQVLNGPVRTDAVQWARAMEVFQYGFHIRSIHGYPNTVDATQVRARQKQAEADRKKRSGLRRDPVTGRYM